MVGLASNVKQANFRLPLSYMDFIDEVAGRESITKAAVITRALDCMRASYDSGHGGMPVEGVSDNAASAEEIKKLKEQLSQAEARAEKASRSTGENDFRVADAKKAKEAADSARAAAEREKSEALSAKAAAEAKVKDLQDRLNEAEKQLKDNNSRYGSIEQAYSDAESRIKAAEQARDAAESRLRTAEQDRDSALSRLRTAEQDRDDAETKARQANSELAAAQAKASNSYAAEEELSRLRAQTAKQEATIEEKTRTLAAKEAELASKSAAIEERDARIMTLSQQLGTANAKIELAQTANEVKAVVVGDNSPVDEDTEKALYMFNMLGGVMGAFQQQVADARSVGEQEGRSAMQREFQEMIDKARNDGYRDAMGYLDNRVTNARETGAREERARIANMSYFERRRYLRMHIA